MGPQPVIYELVDSVAVLTLNSPERRNALSVGMLSALKTHLDGIKEDRRVRAVILRALGPVFSSGHDLRELTNGVEEDYASTFSQATEVMEAIRLLPVGGLL